MGSQAVYDRALRETFLRSDLVPCEMSLVLINDDGSPLPPEYACAVKLRSILLDLDAELVFLQEHVRTHTATPANSIGVVSWIFIEILHYTMLLLCDCQKE